MAKKKEIRKPILYSLLEENDVAFETLPNETSEKLIEQWLSTFSKNVTRKQKRDCRMDQYPWHLFSFNVVPSLLGEAALKKYASKKDEEFYVIDLVGGDGIRCLSDLKPDFGPARSEIYVFPEDLSWTMVFTHEYGWFGPYYCDRNMLREAQVAKTPSR